MKTFESLFSELKTKIENKDPNSYTVKEYEKGVHFIGKKIIEEAGEVWIASEYEGNEKTAEEMSQLIYHIQVMMLAKGITIDDIYGYL
ncbi:MAG: phosphoribosyl-ATP diphosphatase [Chitinivibrionia bacterium]|nr:phosphoribosyl-ATP diphosphatase [Chitinivibrionia bacterium]